MNFELLHASVLKGHGFSRAVPLSDNFGLQPLEGPQFSVCIADEPVEGSMPKTTITDARRRLSEVLDRAERGDRIILHGHGKPAAAIVPSEDLELIERYEDEIDIRLARKARKEKGRIPWEQIKKELNL